MTADARALETYKKMKKFFRILTISSLATSVFATALAAYMMKLGTPPLEADYATYEKWLTDHQPQLLAERAGQFYWTEINTAFVLGGIAICLLLVALCSAQVLIISKVSRVTASAVLAER